MDRSGGIIGVRVIPPVQIRPKEGLIDPEEFYLVSRGDGMGIFQSEPEWKTVPLEMMQNAEETKRGNKECDKGQNPPQSCKCAPNKNE